MIEQTWDEEKVKYWLNIAAAVDKALPPVKIPQVTGQKWDIIREWYELLWDDDKEVVSRFQPTNEQISMWEEVVLRWFKLIDSDKDKKIVWMRSCEICYSKISRKLGLSRQTLTTRYKRAIENLTEALNRKYPKNG